MHQLARWLITIQSVTLANVEFLHSVTYIRSMSIQNSENFSISCVQVVLC